MILRILAILAIGVCTLSISGHASPRPGSIDVDHSAQAVDVHWREVIRLGQQSSGSRSAIDRLVAALADDDAGVRYAAGAALVHMSQDALPELESRLKSEREPIATELLTILKLINIDPRMEPTALVRLAMQPPLANDDQSLSALWFNFRIEEAKMRLQRGGAPEVGAILNALRNADEPNWLTGMSLLRSLTAYTPAAVQGLVKLYQDGSPKVRTAAIDALCSDPKHTEVAIPTVIEAMSDIDVEVAEMASSGVAIYGEAALSAVPHLIERLRREVEWLPPPSDSREPGTEGEWIEQPIDPVVLDVETSSPYPAANSLFRMGEAAMKLLDEAAEESGNGDFKRAVTQLRNMPIWSHGCGTAERVVATALRWLTQEVQRLPAVASVVKEGHAPAIDDKLDCDIRAAAWMSLALSGAGQTRDAKSGAFRIDADRALRGLVGRLPLDPNPATDRRRNLEAHALATLALCEAHRQTDDESLRRPVWEALRYLLASQDRDSGGWGDQFGKPGTMRVTGWAVLALHAGQTAKLIDGLDPAIVRAHRFLDRVETDHGAAYGNERRGNEPTATAIGLLCRALLGWEPEHAALVKGAESLAHRGPEEFDANGRLFATMFLHHRNGPDWDTWNRQQRRLLVGSLERDGANAGSWPGVEGEPDSAEQRFERTALATLSLEAYYRYLSIFGKLVPDE